MSNESRELERLHEGFRFFSYLLLFVTLYLTQLSYFADKGMYLPVTGLVLNNLLQLKFLGHVVISKAVCMVFLAITCIGTKAKKDRDLEVSTIVIQVVAGSIVYWGSILLLPLSVPIYLAMSFAGFVLLNIGFDNVSKLINVNLMKDRFNMENESFPQEQALMDNEYSVNLPTRYRFRNSDCEGWINVVNPFRGTMVIGTPGSGKSFSVVLPFIRQHLDKGFTLCVYDFKYPDLSEVAYNHFLKAKRKAVLPDTAAFYSINFDDIQKSYRCNPLAPELMESPIDAFESSRTVLYNLNREWIRKQGSFFPNRQFLFCRRYLVPEKVPER
jgi:hypothetical protein